MAKLSDLIRARQAARILRCHESHIYKLARAGVFTRHYIGTRAYRLRKSEVLHYVHANIVR